MQGTETTVHTLATEAASWFETATRTGGDGETFTRCKDRAPDWVTDLVHDAHGDFLPDDWRYQTISAALDAIEDAGEDADLDDLASEFADGHVDVYTAARFTWLSSSLNRQGYVDEACEEFGFQFDSGHGIADAVGLGQYREAEEVFQAVVVFLAARADA